MHAVKIFADNSLFDIEETINAWLTVNPTVQITNITQSSCKIEDDEPLYSIVIVYKAA
jgi:hypothetical protein